MMSNIAIRPSTIIFKVETKFGGRRGYNASVKLDGEHVEVALNGLGKTFTATQSAEVGKNLGRGVVSLKDAVDGKGGPHVEWADVASFEIWNLLVCRALGHHPTSSMVLFCDTRMGVPFSATADFVDPRLSADVDADGRYRITISVDLDDHCVILSIGDDGWRLDFTEARWLAEHMSVAAVLQGNRTVKQRLTGSTGEQV
jgi:hypothetical protein